MFFTNLNSMSGLGGRIFSFDDMMDGKKMVAKSDKMNDETVYLWKDKLQFMGG